MPRKVWLTAAVALLAVAALLAPRAAGAEGPSCRSQCWEAYGICYKSTSKRQRCQSLLQRCLSVCLRAGKR